ncbi:sporulation protein YabP [Limnochorda pilosa]|uniref:Spore coat protein n=1 Tax=Limnochorda pilosa TaxID=1555112 RepID=A0A0K2SRC6_LIMPI|nr:sporulation protein YabP [Limnochorda pilosa]BAS29399.1 spore coat protein [Limnochorda pilosa]
MAADRPDEGLRRRHELHLLQRQHLQVTGVADVESFDEKEIVLRTEMGGLLIQGAGMHIAELNVESGLLLVKGEVQQLQYLGEGSAQKGRNLLKRLFR